MDTDRQYWLASMLRIVRPVLEALSERRLKASMPVEQNAGDRQEFTHLEALGRKLSGLAPWIETGEAVGEDSFAAYFSNWLLLSCWNTYANKNA